MRLPTVCGKDSIETKSFLGLYTQWKLLLLVTSICDAQTGGLSVQNDYTFESMSCLLMGKNREIEELKL